MPFTEFQSKALAAKLNSKHIKTRACNGLTLSYIEGWHVISEANRIFGFDAWDRETVFAQCVSEGRQQGQYGCSYIARVRVRVRAEDIVVTREGSGSGNGIAASPGEAHENALKGAETDAMKRAFVTFGNPFGLALYDKQQKGVRYSTLKSAGRPIQWSVLAPGGKKLSGHKDPVAYCTAVREVLKGISDAETLLAFWKNNQEAIAQLRAHLPELKTEKGQHYGEILGTLYTERLQELVARQNKDVEKDHSPRNSGPAQRPSLKKMDTPAKGPRRVRNSAHLKFVSSRNCMVCGRTPCHAHHLLFVQPRALSRKPSDEWAVPLCAIHHRALHDHGNEREWWRQHDLDAKKEALRLWQKSNQLLKTG